MEIYTLDPKQIKEDLENEINSLIRTRSECRRKRDFEGADKIRGELQQHGVRLLTLICFEVVL